MATVQLSNVTNNDLIKTLSHTNPVLGYFMPEKTWEYQKNFFAGVPLADLAEQANVLYSDIMNKIGRSMVLSSKIVDELDFIEELAGMNYGDIIEQIHVGLTTTYSFDPLNEYNPYIRQADDVKALYISKAFQEYFQQTIMYSDTRRAFTNANGLGLLMSKKLSSMTDTKRVAMNFKKKNLLKLAEHEYAQEKVAEPVDQETAEQFIKDILILARKMRQNKRDYNAANVIVSSDISEMVLVIDQKYESVIKVDMLSKAFNKEELELPYTIKYVAEIGNTSKYYTLNETTGVPEFVEGAGVIDGAVGLLVHKDFFKVDIELEYHDMQRNAKGRYTNHFLHHDGKTYVSLFLPAVCLYKSGHKIPARPATSYWVNQRAKDDATLPVPDETEGE